MAAFPPWGPNCAHTDGDAFGDLFPPFGEHDRLLVSVFSRWVALVTPMGLCSSLPALCAHQSADGGENALVDASFVLDEMERGPPELQQTAALLRTVPVDQSEYGVDGETATGAVCVS